MSARHRNLVPLHRQILAGVSVALLLLLSVLAASPSLHRALHADADHDSHECAVVLFASGVTLALGTFVVAAPAAVWRVQPAVVLSELLLASPRYLRQPERGPPVA